VKTREGNRAQTEDTGDQAWSSNIFFVLSQGSPTGFVGGQHWLWKVHGGRPDLQSGLRLTNIVMWCI
jgi:hypothetical protein